MEEMSPWASRRKSIYLGGIVIMLSAIAFAIFWKYWYHVPTCFDNLKNGDESGIDCGGSCTLICSGDVIKPIIRWDPRLFEVSPGLWSALIYIENSNINIDAIYMPYKLTIYDEKNNILEERKSATILPKNKTVGVFEGSIEIKDNIRPRRAVFEIGENIVWQKNNKKGEDIDITHSPLLRLDSIPRVEANVKNNSTEEIKNIELVIAIFDGNDNAIAASRTFVESLKKNEETDIFFTWPKPFELGSKMCESPSNVMLLLDRSGSMASLGSNPPEPLTTAKAAANSFVMQLSPKDKIGVVSFATKAKDPIDLNLTSDLNFATEAVGGISIEEGSIQYTNIFEALHSGWQELVSARAEENSSNIIILLTDGIANNPKNPTGRTEEEDIKYAESVAMKEATDAKAGGVIIYTIGLGNEINEPFLKTLVSEKDNYFFAPSAQNLKTIYDNISSDICQEIPARIEISYKIFGTSI